jgi:hypothetical protein
MQELAGKASTFNWDFGSYEKVASDTYQPRSLQALSG